MKPTVIFAAAALAGILGCDYDDRTAGPGDRTTPSTSPSMEAPADPRTTTPAPTTPAPTPSTPTTMSEADRELAQRVADTLRQDGTLGAVAQNITVLADNGTITLRGSVSSEQEKNDLAAKAQQVAGVTQVNNELEVSSASS